MVNIENESPCQVRVCKKLSLCQFEGSKKNSAAKRLTRNIPRYKLYVNKLATFLFTDICKNSRVMDIVSYL